MFVTTRTLDGLPGAWHVGAKPLDSCSHRNTTRERRGAVRTQHVMATTGKSRRAALFVAGFAGMLAFAGATGTATAQQFPAGYQLNKYEPSTVGDPFLYVEHPWYSSIRYFAIGLTFDYAHNLLVTGDRDARG